MPVTQPVITDVAKLGQLPIITPAVLVVVQHRHVPSVEQRVQFRRIVPLRLAKRMQLVLRQAIKLAQSALFAAKP